jgi:hypothetical protein
MIGYADQLPVDQRRICPLITEKSERVSNEAGRKNGGQSAAINFEAQDDNGI